MQRRSSVFQFSIFQYKSTSKNQFLMLIHAKNATNRHCIMKFDVFLTQRHGGTEKQGTGLSPLCLCVSVCKNKNETTQCLETKHVTFKVGNFVATLSTNRPFAYFAQRLQYTVNGIKLVVFALRSSLRSLRTLRLKRI